MQGDTLRQDGEYILLFLWANLLHRLCLRTDMVDMINLCFSFAMSVPVRKSHSHSFVRHEHCDTQVRQTKAEFTLLASLDSSRLGIDNVGLSHLIH